MGYRDYNLTSSVSEMILALKRPSLEQHCLHNRLIMFYNLVNKSVIINMPQHYHPFTCMYLLSSTSLYSAKVINNILPDEFFLKTIHTV